MIGKVPFASILLVLLGAVQVTPSCGEGLTILCAGDLLLGGPVTPVMAEKGVRFPFEGTVDLLREADIAICNLEAPFGTGGEPFDKKFAFRVLPQYAKGLTYAGIDLVTLANNHIMDYGVESLKTTLSLLDDEGIGHAGAGLDIGRARRPAILERNGMKVALLSYSNTFPEAFYATRSKAGTAPGYEKYLREDIPKAAKEADFVIVSFHWGGELNQRPLSYQRRLARLSVKLGADLVFGHHPHTLQGIEVYGSGLIAYSLGNFVFGSLSPRAKGAFLRLKLSREGIESAEVIPLCVRNDLVGYQPKVLGGEEGASELRELRNLSLLLGTEISLEGGVGHIQLP